MRLGCDFSLIGLQKRSAGSDPAQDAGSLEPAHPDSCRRACLHIQGASVPGLIAPAAPCRCIWTTFPAQPGASIPSPWRSELHGFGLGFAAFTQTQGDAIRCSDWGGSCLSPQRASSSALHLGNGGNEVVPGGMLHRRNGNVFGGAAGGALPAAGRIGRRPGPAASSGCCGHVVATLAPARPQASPP